MKSLFLSAIFIYLGTGFYLYLVQRDFIYFPVQATNSTLQQRLFKNDGHVIKASVLNRGNDKAIIYFGGNAEVVEFNAVTFSRLFSNYTVYLVNYRGYGGSTGEPTEEGIYSDALHVHEMISKEHGKVSIIGRSLGSAVATYVASKRVVHKLVLITPFDSIQNVAQSLYPIYPMSILLKDKHDSFSRVKAISAETLVIAAEQDRIIEMDHTRRLVEGFDKEVLFHVIKGAGHNDISAYPGYVGVLGDFM